MGAGAAAGAALNANANPNAADLIEIAPDLSKEEVRERLDRAFAQMAAASGVIVVLLGEVERSQSFRDEGATSTVAWAAERYGISSALARSLAHVGERAPDLRVLVGALCAGEVSFDKVRVVADGATPQNEGELCALARDHGVRELADIARTSAERQAAAAGTSAAPWRPGGEHERRYLRFNDACRTLTAQLPAESYAQAKACLEARAREIPSETEIPSEGEVPAEGQVPWDHRLHDAFMGIIGSSVPGSGTGAATASPFLVVAHVALGALVGDAGHGSVLAAELEHHGLIDTETVQRLACDADLALAVDDDVGHTMYEGRARRFATRAQRREVVRRDRQCRFPGCANVTFADVHHIAPWERGGRSDLDNLVLMCRHHHGVVHRNGWTMTGNANEELRIVGPSGRVMVSRPSPLWTRVTDGRRSGPAGGAGGAGGAGRS
jgi:Domain of unknown function (DUF222)/HNH endonuclease